MKVHPDSRSNDALSTPANAHDNNLNTFAGFSATRSCNAQGSGSATTSTEYYNLGQVTNPQTLVVKWDGSGSGLLWSASNSLQATTKIEYQLTQGGAWSVLAQYAYQLPAPPGGNPPSPGIIESSTSLGSLQSTANIRVRVGMTLSTSCASGFNIGSITGTMHVYDIRVLAPLPDLYGSPSPITRGDNVTISFAVPPRTTIQGWRFEPFGYSAVVRSQNVNSSTWPGVLVASGNVYVNITVADEPFTLDGEVDVNRRSWSNPTPSAVEDDVTNIVSVCDPGLGLLPVPPVSKADLGYGCPYFDITHFQDHLADGGPNHGFWYITAFNTAGTAYPFVINSDAADSGSYFYQNQTGIPPWISGGDLLHGLRRHENGDCSAPGPLCGHYGYFKLEYIKPENNFTAVAEALIGEPGISDQDFYESYIAAMNEIYNRIDENSFTLPCQPEYDDSCSEKLGDINFSLPPQE
jgi:hypothetical protein